MFGGGKVQPWVGTAGDGDVDEHGNGNGNGNGDVWGRPAEAGVNGGGGDAQVGPAAGKCNRGWGRPGTGMWMGREQGRPGATTQQWDRDGDKHGGDGGG